MPIVVSCECGQCYEAADWLAGRIVPCPKCCFPLIVSAEPDKIFDLGAAKPSRLVRFRCLCGKRLKASRKLLGSWVSCTRCGDQVLVQNNRIKTRRRGTTYDSPSEGHGNGLRDLGVGDTAIWPNVPGADPYWDEKNELDKLKRRKPYELSNLAMVAIIGGWVGAIALLLASYLVRPQMESENVGQNDSEAGVEIPAGANQVAVASVPKWIETPKSGGEQGVNSWNPFLGWSKTSGPSPQHGWILYNSTTGGFAIEFPGVPEANPVPQPLGTVGIQEFSATLVLPGSFRFEARRVRTTSVIPSVADRTNQNREEMLLTRTVEKWKGVSQRELLIQGTPGYEEKFVFQKADGQYTVIGRAFRRKGHQYILHCEAPIGRFDEAEASRFLESFKITSPE